jgi:hypothetical protein
MRFPFCALNVSRIIFNAVILQQTDEFFFKRHSGLALFLHRAPLTLRAGRRQRGKKGFSFAYPAFAPAARVARLGPCWANLFSRLRRFSFDVPSISLVPQSFLRQGVELHR